jgi:hypothetical protein
MTQQDYPKPIAPTPDLVQQWLDASLQASGKETSLAYIATRAAQWGADQQLLKDAKWLDQNALNESHLKITPIGESLIEVMRPRPLSLKEQALAALDTEPEDAKELIVFDTDQVNIIRRALEQFDD